MQTRILGKTGISVPVVGFGAWQLGNVRDFGAMEETAAVGLVHAALEQGCNYFDTAPGYGQGASETLLGKALAGRRAGATISSKVGHYVDAEGVFQPERLRGTVEASLGRLQTDYLDILLLHNPPYEVLDGTLPQWDVLRALRAEGKIRAYGASLDWGREVRRFAAATDGQVIELLLNVFHQEPTLAFDAVCCANIGIIAKVPLDSGWLAGRYTAESTFTGIRGRWTPEVIARRAALVERLRGIVREGEAPAEPVTMVQAALRYLLALPEVATVIPGVRDLAQLAENLSAADVPMPAATVARVRAFWEEELKDNPLPW
jgi:aryl-alcohol dehydrogenase-like predicted oxidoreductase